MRLLAVDTSSRAMSAAVAEDGCLISYRLIEDGNKSDEMIIPCVDGALKDAGITPKDIDVFAVVVGPGSFTGLRIGISFIKAFAYSLDRPCVGVSSLDVIAYGCSKGFETAKSDALVCSVMDARNDRFYTAVYSMERLFDSDGLRLPGVSFTKTRILGACIFDEGELYDKLRQLASEYPRSASRVIFGGDAATRFTGNQISEPEGIGSIGFGFTGILINAKDMPQNAALAALLSFEEYKNEPGASATIAALLTPYYMNDVNFKKLNRMPQDK